MYYDIINVQNNGSSLYGNFRTRTFADIFPTEEEFEEVYNDCGIPPTFSQSTSINTLYYLLYARYGNSNVASSDENQFKYKVCALIFQYGPTWEKRLEIQGKLRALNETELITGGKAIYNHSYNPSTAPTTSTLEELTTINDQNTTNYKKSKLEAYSTLMALLETDVTNEFLDKFKKLFITIVEPDYPLWYETENDEDINE